MRDFVIHVLPVLVIVIALLIFSKRMEALFQYVPTADERDEKHLTTYELERLEREEEFDSRINKMKEELALQQQILRHGTVADELHPLVRNLPHDVIKYISSEDDVEEIAD